jgi:hypothetical protein
MSSERCGHNCPLQPIQQACHEANGPVSVGTRRPKMLAHFRRGRPAIRSTPRQAMSSNVRK